MAHPRHAAVVRLRRPGHGRSAARYPTAARVRGPESPLCKFRHRRERHGLAGALRDEINGLLGERGLILRQGTRVDATRMAAPTSTNNAKGERDVQRRSTKKGKPWYLGMKAPVGVDTAHGLVHTGVGTAAKVPNVKLTATLLHGEAQQVHGHDPGVQPLGE